jgi:hypothetical protein
MTVESFREAAALLAGNGIDLRVFILLNPPFLGGEAAVEWACRSIDVAAECGATACSVIPTRTGNGAMESLRSNGPGCPLSSGSSSTASRRDACASSRISGTSNSSSTASVPRRGTTGCGG